MLFLSSNDRSRFPTGEKYNAAAAAAIASSQRGGGGGGGGGQANGTGR